MEERINVKYIGVVSAEADGKVLYKQNPIEKEYTELTEKLEDMVNNENSLECRNLLDY